MLTAAILGWHPHQTLKTTLPELQIAIKAWRQSHGQAADTSPPAMSRNRLMALAKEIG